MPERVEVLGVQFPGRGARFGEPCIDNIDDLVGALHKEISPYLDCPFMFFGHSNGALVAYELASQLSATGCALPDHLILSAKRAPHLPRLQPPLWNLPHDAFVRELRAYNGTPEEVFGDEQLLRLMIPAIRADFALSDCYVYRKKAALDTRLTVFYSTQDAYAPIADVLEWSQHVTGDFHAHAFNGDHFFLTTDLARVLERIEIIVTSTLMNA